jgi:hypothetical protein
MTATCDAVTLGTLTLAANESGRHKVEPSGCHRS